MNRLLTALFLLLVLATGCARLPAILPPPISNIAGAADPFRDIYPSGRWQLYHTIEARVPGGGTHHLTGVSVISSDTRQIQCALMTIEGLVLFSGGYKDGTLTVDRVVSPFDRDGFAQGLVDDLRLLFFQPEASARETGVLSDGDRVRRYPSDDGGTTDLILRKDGIWTIHRYAGSKLECTVTARDVRADESTDGAPFARTLILNRPGLLGYTLEMTLVEALRLK